MSYNGWSDRETWVLNLWWSNDEGLYKALTEQCEAALDYHDDFWEAVRDIESYLSDDFEILVAEVPNMMIRDLVGTPDFREVAESWVREVWNEREEERDAEISSL